MRKLDLTFIVGNGSSRKDVDLNTLVPHGRIFGCNALYRDFDGWDVLVAVDPPMIEEIKTKTNPRGIRLNQKIYEPVGLEMFENDFNGNKKLEKWTARKANSGMLAMEVAIREKAGTLFCLGFDFILNGVDSVSNIYEGTKHYEKAATHNDNVHRLYYLERFCREYSSTKFIFVIPDKAMTKPIEANNVQGMTMTTFKKMIEDMTCQSGSN